MANKTTFTSRSSGPGDNIRINNNNILLQPKVLNAASVLVTTNPPIVNTHTTGSINAVVTRPPIYDKIPTTLKDQLLNQVLVAHQQVVSGQIRPQTVPRDKLNIPISPAPKASDEVLFEAPDKSTKYYLPRYRISQTGGKFGVRLEKAPGNEVTSWQLTVNLMKYAASPIEKQVINAKVMDHQVEVSLHYSAPTTNAGNIARQLQFQELTFQPDGSLQAVLKTSDIRERDQIYEALTTLGYQAKLAIKRKAWMAFPVYTPLNINELDSEKHKPILIFKGLEDYNVKEKTFTHARLSVLNREIYPLDLFQPAPDLPPCGQNKNASRTWVNIFTGEGKRIYGFCALTQNEQLSELGFAFPKGTLPSKTCYIELEDRRKNKKYISTVVEITGEGASDSPPYYVSNETFEGVEEFYFKNELHEYIYQGITGSSSQQNELNSYPVTWKGQPHIYLREGDSGRFFYLPDEFKLARTAGLIRVPWIRVEYIGKTILDTKAIISYQLERYEDLQRLEDAKKQLLAKVGNATIKSIELLRLLPGEDKLIYKLFLPGGSAATERSEASVDLNKIDDFLPPLSMDDLRTTLNTLLSDTQTNRVLRGNVTVKLAGIDIPAIPVSIRFEDAVGELFDITETVDTTTKIFHIKLRNAIESAIHIAGVNISIKDGERLVTAKTSGLTFPLQLASLQTIEFDVIPEGAIANLETADIIYSWQNLDIKSDPEAAYNNIVDMTVTGSYEKPITVRQIADSFTEGSPIRAMKIDFSNAESGAILKTISFDKERKEETVKNLILSVPIKDYVLDKPTSGQYWYKITTITGTVGSDQRTVAIEGKWKADTTEELFITTADLPVSEPL